MSLSSLNPSASVAYNDGYSSRQQQEDSRSQTAPRDTFESDVAAATAAIENSLEATEVDPASFTTVIRTDFSGLGERKAGAEANPAPAEANSNQFLGSFSRLLAAVQSGDATGARDAANTLQFELFSGAGALQAAQASAVDAPIQMLIDLQALIRAAWLGDIESADRAALSLATDMQSALLSAPTQSRLASRRSRAGGPAQENSSLVQGANAAYETLMDLDPGAA